MNMRTKIKVLLLKITQIYLVTYQTRMAELDKYKEASAAPLLRSRNLWANKT